MPSIILFSCLVVASAAAAALCLALLARRQRVPAAAVEWLLLFAIPLSVLLGHMLPMLLLANLNLPTYGVMILFQPWQGEFMFYGVVLGCVLAALLACRLTKTPLPAMLDVLSVALLVFIACIRLSEPFDTALGRSQGYGLEATDGPALFQHFPFSFAIDADYPEERYFSLFLLEALWALGAAVHCIRTLPRRKAGQTTLLAATLYAAGQCTFEFLRQDHVVKMQFVRLSQVISALLLLLIVALTAKSFRRLWRHGLLLLALAGLVIAMEFGDEKPLILSGDLKIFFPHWFTYGVIALSSVGMGLTTWHCAKEA